MKKVFLFVISILISQLSFSQIYILDFDTNNIGYTSGPDGFGNDGASATDYYDISATGFGGTYNSSTGNFMAAQDIDGVSGFSSSTQTFEMNAIDITNFINLTFAMDIAEDDGLGWDDNDVFIVEYRVDGGSYSTLLEVGVTSGFNQTPIILSSSNAAIVGTSLTDVFTNFSGPISSTGASLDVKITMMLPSGNEDIAFDNFVVNGDNNSGTPSIVLTAPAGNTSETGTTTTFTAVLNTAPSSNVVLDIVSGDTGENTASPAMITFSTSDWDTPKIITLTGIDDALFDGDQTTTITVSSNNAMTNDLDYQNLQETVDVINTDDEELTNDDVRINELDADQTGTDFAEFIELFGTPNLSLTGLVVVMYNGSDDKSYDSYDLDGYNLDANGYFIIGQEGAPFNPEIFLTNNKIQNGADGVALYIGNGSDFPNDTPISQVGLIDALVYGTNDSDDAGLSSLYLNQPFLDDLTEEFQVDEDVNNDQENQSIQRGSWFVAAPTPRGENILPVELISFTLSSKNNQNVLAWITATEINNDFFAIERSKNGNDFETIGKVTGKGNSYSSIEYSYVDASPLTGANYYRLKQVDFDGKFEFSDIIRANNTKSRISIYPTSTSDYITIDMDEQQVASVVVFNEIGQTIKEMTISEMKTRINISDLPTGMYFIQVNAQNGKEVKKIIKQ